MITEYFNLLNSGITQALGNHTFEFYNDCWIQVVSATLYDYPKNT